MIAPPHMWAGCALDNVLDERQRASSVAESLARASNAASVPRLHGLNLEAAGPEKLWGGHASPWTGAVLSAAYGAMWITHAKLLRTHASAQRLLAGNMHVTDYRAFIGFVVSLSACRVHSTYEMQGLWAPLQAGGELELGPNTIVMCWGERRALFRQRWRHISKRILDTPGISVLVAAGVHHPRPNDTPAR